MVWLWFGYVTSEYISRFGDGRLAYWCQLNQFTEGEHIAHKPSAKENKMLQQTHTVQDHANNTASETSRRYAQSFVRILQVIWGIISKVAGFLLNGFHLFVAGAEQSRSPQNDYWWDSTEIVDDLFNR